MALRIQIPETVNGRSCQEVDDGDAEKCPGRRRWIGSLFVFLRAALVRRPHDYTFSLQRSPHGGCINAEPFTQPCA